MEEKQFEQEYKAWKKQDVPDLWERIEPRLEEHVQKQAKKKQGMYYLMRYGISAAAAVVIVLILPGAYRHIENVLEGQSSGRAEAQETIAAQETVESQESLKAQEAIEEGGLSKEGKRTQEKTPPGLLTYQQLGLKEENSFIVPDNAVSVPEDTGYFSEDILGDTELLCSGTVETISLEYNEHQQAAKVVYQISLEAVHYAQDYISPSGSITVKSPIVETEGDEAYLLYQLQVEGRYLLPLKKEGGNWELIYPFAPQIQITQADSYVFHSGYASLINHETHVVLARQEGANDYFYDRMLMREDKEFLSEFLELMERQIKEKS